MTPMDGRRARRSYHQYCAVARGLDLIGDRWTLLLVRDLMLGPKRYKDLLEGMPGMGTNLLAARLRDLEGIGVLERAVLPPPAGSNVYQLTERGHGLWPVVTAIGRWGAQFLGPVQGDDIVLPSAYFVAMRSVFRADLARSVSNTIEIRIGRHVYEVRVDGGECTTREAQATDPDAVLTMDVQTLNAVLFGHIDPDDAISTGQVQLDGDPHSLRQLVTLFPFGQHPASG